MTACTQNEKIESYEGILFKNDRSLATLLKTKYMKKRARNIPQQCQIMIMKDGRGKVTV